MFKHTREASVIRWSWVCDLREAHLSMMMMMKYLSSQRSLATSVSVLARVDVVDRLLMIARYLGGTLVALLEACALSIPSATTCTHTWIDCCCLQPQRRGPPFVCLRLGYSIQASWERSMNVCLLFVCWALSCLCVQRIRLLSAQ